MKFTKGFQKVDASECPEGQKGNGSHVMLVDMFLFLQW